MILGIMSTTIGIGVKGNDNDNLGRVRPCCGDTVIEGIY